MADAHAMTGEVAYQPPLRQRYDSRDAAVIGGGYTFKETWATPRVGLEYSFASGDHNAGDSKHGRGDDGKTRETGRRHAKTREGIHGRLRGE